MPFKMVCALWVSPDFSNVMAGHGLPPRVDHSQVDFSALCSFFEDLFPYGPPVSIQVPNDTIDQVTVHLREVKGGAPTLRCEDFGKALLAQATRQPDPIVDVRHAWEGLHELVNRRQAPPPVALPFVVTAEDFEDAMTWRTSARSSLGLPPIDVPYAVGNPKGVEHVGALTKDAREKLAAIFGSSFEGPAVLDEMYSDPHPEYACG